MNWFWDNGLKGALAFVALFVGFGLLWAPYVEAQLTEEVCIPIERINEAAAKKGMTFRTLGVEVGPRHGNVLAIYRNSDGSLWSIWSTNPTVGCFMARGTDLVNYDTEQNPEEMTP